MANTSDEIEDINDAIRRSLCYLDIGSYYQNERIVSEVMEQIDDSINFKVQHVLQTFVNTGQISKFHFNIKKDVLEIIYAPTFPAQFTVLKLNLNTLTKDLYDIGYIIES